MRMEGRTETLLTKLIVALRKFENASKNDCTRLGETAPSLVCVFNSVITHLDEA
jgi:hypothetical protein